MSERQAAEVAAIARSLDLPARPGVGTVGRPMRLSANYYEVTKLPLNSDIIQYTVDVEPDIPRNLRRSLFSQVLERGAQYFGSSATTVAFDGMSNLFSVGPLPTDQPFEVITELPARRKNDEPRRFSFRFRRVAAIRVADLDDFMRGRQHIVPQMVVTALDVFMRHQICSSGTSAGSNMVVVGRSVFAGDQVAPISGAVDVWRGFFFSLRPAANRLLLNCDTAVGAFFAAGPLLAIIRDLVGAPKDRPLEIDSRHRHVVESFLSHVRIGVTHRGPDFKRRFKVLGLSRTGANSTMFEMGDAAGGQQQQQSSVAQYFEAQYSIKLREPSLPCVVVGSSLRPIFLPIEVCIVAPGQRYLRKLDGQQTSDMIRIANQPPRVRMEGIEQAAGFLSQGGSNSAMARLNQCGLEFGRQLTTVDARVLPTPTIFYNQRSRSEPQVSPQNGQWNLRDKCLEIGAQLRSWAVVVFGGRTNPQEVEGFVRELVMTSEEVGVAVEKRNPPIISATQNVQESVQRAYAEAERASGHPPQIILCMLPTDDARLYGEIKYTTDTIVGLPSQCMLQKHLRRPNKQYCANIMLKINVKLGGVNSSLGRQVDFVCSAPTMIMGADVTHPGLGDSSDKPSIAAMVGSMDIKLSRYAAAVRVQGNRVEMISDMTAMAVELLDQFRQTNRRLPSRILFYRDGVSEGQFPVVVQYELQHLRAACKQIGGEGYAPKISFVLVQKRHHTRFFPTNQRDSDRSGNVPAGTVVDTGVVHPTQFDFFLCSHSGIQGTSRPAHYHVVHDENAFTVDNLQMLTFQLCHTFARCTRSVGVVTPVYYAHLVAFRARYHFTNEGMSHVVPSLAANMYFL